MTGEHRVIRIGGYTAHVARADGDGSWGGQIVRDRHFTDVPALVAALNGHRSAEEAESAARRAIIEDMERVLANLDRALAEHEREDGER